jgi:mRNA-degrading endonuclease toxin of MazEF toxin-antitoxin module
MNINPSKPKILYTSEDYNLWNKRKQKLNSQKRVFFNEGEIWWSSVGLNIGMEINGKNHLYQRPILILKKLGHNTFIGVPLSTSVREGNFYFTIETKGITGQLMFNQIKVMDSKRLLRKISKLNSNKLIEIKNNLKNIF